MAKRSKKIYDADGVQVTDGCEVSFSYGIPPVGVIAPVIERDGDLIVITKGHHPEESYAMHLKDAVGDFYVRKIGRFHVREDGKHVRKT
jgi:hypothetical protein